MKGTSNVATNMGKKLSTTKVSVIIPTYNYAQFLGETIQSVLDQSYTNFELIVVDDGSTDNTREVVGSLKDSRIRYIYQKNSGASSARNTGIKASAAEYVTFLDSDDIWLPENLELKVKLLDSRPDISLVCSNALVFNNGTGAIIGRLWHDQNGAHANFDAVKVAREPLKEFLYHGFFVIIEATMIRREVFSKIGCFDESLPTYEDWDLIIRILQHFSIEIIDMPLLKIRRHFTNLSGNPENVYQGAVTAINKAICSGSFSGVELKLLKQRLARAYFRYGRCALLDNNKSKAKEALITSIKHNPWNIKFYIYLLFTFLGKGRILALNNWKKVLRNRTANYQPNADSQLISN
jgi:glycosyltransferase involved in cell wall biosynthesis